jgi:hypothetical protein
MTEPGWFPDPQQGNGLLRWWDGQVWTSHTVDAPPPDATTTSSDKKRRRREKDGSDDPRPGDVKVLTCSPLTARRRTEKKLQALSRVGGVALKTGSLLGGEPPPALGETRTGA